jgi:hypothetical protein
MVRGLRPGDPRRVGPYELTGVLGSGGMGQVFLGWSAGGRPVAVKVIRAELAEDPEFRKRFRYEVAAARKVSGMFTALVADADVDGPTPWLATAYVPGPSLAQAVAEHGPLPAEALPALMAGLAEGLAAIHAAGVVHRDLKPSNVLLAADGPRVIDFGISRAAENSALTHTGVVIGSPGFMSPEQAEGREIGPPSDIFNLGAVLAFAATGHGPFGGGQTAALIYRVVHGSPSLEQVPENIRPLVQRCLDKDPARRPTASDLLRQTSPRQPEPGWLPETVIGAIARDGLPRRADEGRTASVMSGPAPDTAPPQLQREVIARPGSTAAKPQRRSRRTLAVAGLTASLLAAAAAAFVLTGGFTATPHKPQAGAAATASQAAARAASLPLQNASPTPAAQSTRTRTPTTPATQGPAPLGTAPATQAPTAPGATPAGHPSHTQPPSSPADHTTPQPASSSASCNFGSLCPAAFDATLTGGAITEQYANDGYVHIAGLNAPPATATISIGDIPGAGTYTLEVWYENNLASDGLTEPRDMTLLVNGHVSGLLDFAVTSSWYESASKETTASVQVPSGISTFAIACQAGDSCHINLWKIELTQ